MGITCARFFENAKSIILGNKTTKKKAKVKKESLEAFNGKDRNKGKRR